jgi:hypothetical protein
MDLITITIIVIVVVVGRVEEKKVLSIREATN